MSSGSNFRFWVPLDDIQKSTDDKGKVVMKLGGIASTIRKDTDGEDLDPEGFDCSYLEERGVVNWNHNKSPEAVIGEPTKVTLTKKGLHVECELYPDSELANKVYNLATTLKNNSKKRRLGYSIEGKATLRDPLNPKSVKKAMITNIALTISPKNADSLVDIIKGEFHELSDEEIIKSNINPLADFDIAANGGETKYLVDITKEDGTRIVVDEDYRIKIDKALSTDSPSGKAVMKESVSGVKEECYLTKAEVIENILDFNSVISLEKADQIYQTLNNLTMSDKTKITSELLNKALVQIGLTEGESQIEKSMDDDNDIEEGVKPAKKKASKAEGEEETEESEEGKDKVEKAVVSAPVVEKTTSDMPSPDFFKSLGIALKGTYDIVKSMENELKSQRELIEGQNEKIGVLETQIQKSIDGIDELGSNAGQRKSIAKAVAKPVEREFNKGLSDADNNIQEEAPSNQVSISQNRNKVLAILDSATFEKGFDDEFGKALTLFESSGQIQPGVAKRLELEKGIKLVG